MALMKNIAASRQFRGFEFTLRQADVATLQNKLSRLNDDVQNRALSKALRAGGRIFIVEAKARERVSNRVERGIRGKMTTVNRIKGYIAGPSAGFPNPAWFEFGTLDQYIGWSNKHKSSYAVKSTKRFMVGNNEWVSIKAGTIISRGIRPRPFLRPAFASKYPAMIDKMANVLNREIIKHGK